ncbi:Nucleotide-binding, alpha-beta plait [Artemisia annua]|uniref:Nucleotide-binding, alpha-beta plait n=1 Tax=Artemisia annua TaxID=35608 RepID=A0A2U1KVD5_ARTAN|nr:Nucleotide-binding, alpha-beta plait [Artemisia annua]
MRSRKFVIKDEPIALLANFLCRHIIGNWNTYWKALSLRNSSFSSKDASHMTQPISRAAKGSRTTPTPTVGTNDAATQPTQAVRTCELHTVNSSNWLIIHEYADQRKLDESGLIGNSLKVSDAPQHESFNDTKEKLVGKIKEVLAILNRKSSSTILFRILTKKLKRIVFTKLLIIDAIVHLVEV